MPQAKTLATTLLAFRFLWSLSADPLPEKPELTTVTNHFNPPIAAASNEGEEAIKKMRLPAGFKVELVAAEPMLAHPVSFSINEKGEFYVAETFRHAAVNQRPPHLDGVLDIRSHMDWLNDDLAAKSVEDRLRMLRQRLGTNVSRMAENSERIRLLVDSNGDGKADTSTVFAEGFNQVQDGIGAGVLARGSNVWYTCIPDLWKLQDKDGDGRADERTSLHNGFGVHIAFLGHDLHGLILGPDGRLYFSIGDRGLNVLTHEGKRLYYPDEGVVLRCQPDGSDLEVVARGLRNPQELAFDEFGNLFTGDNNSDGGDKARWVYLVDGSDSGWRIGYQHIQSPVRRGPWNEENLWHPLHPGQPAYLIPPIINLGYGPSGLAYYPGTGLPPKYRNHFFLCDFRGGASSGIHTFSLKPKGAGFDLVEYEQFLWEILPTDVEFGVEPGLYYSDWVEGWTKTGKGRLYHVFDPALKSDSLALSTKNILRSNLEEKPLAELTLLLAHADMRVRQAAQFAMVNRAGTSGRAVVDLFQQNARTNSSLLARLHSIWGLGQLSRQTITVSTPIHSMPKLSEKGVKIKKIPLKIAATVLPPLAQLLNDAHPEIRAQTARVLGESHYDKAFEGVEKLLLDPNPRVRMFAALALPRLVEDQALSIPTGSLFEILRQNADRDPYLRHAAVMGLARPGNMAALMQGAGHPNPSIRRGVLLALRRLQRPEISRFLFDRDLSLVGEAARAINDVPIPDAMPQLANLVHRRDGFISYSSTNSEPIFLRMLNANFRLGTPAGARVLAHVAALSNATSRLRAEAFNALGDWAQPSGRDRVMGLWRPLAPRDPNQAINALLNVLPEAFRGGNQEVGLAAVQAVRRLGIRPAAPLLMEQVGKRRNSPELRAEALLAYADLRPTNLQEVLTRHLQDPTPEVRNVSNRLLARLNPTEAKSQLEKVLAGGTITEKQNALATLGEMEKTEDVLVRSLDQLIAGSLPPEIHLDLLESVAKKQDPAILERLKRFNAARPAIQTANYLETLQGGRFESGKKIFFEKLEVSCLRCHKIKGDGGDVGPDLTGIGGRQSREELLESVLFPNNKIAPGYENVTLTLDNGSTVFGQIKSESEQELVVLSPEDGTVKVPKSRIKTRERGISAMPEEFRQVLTKPEVRDLIEFLAQQK